MINELINLILQADTRSTPVSFLSFSRALKLITSITAVIPAILTPFF